MRSFNRRSHGTKAEGGMEMPHRIDRSDKRDDALDRYATAVTAGTGAASTIAPSGVAYDNMIVAQRRQVTIEISPPTQRIAEPRQPDDDSASRDAQRRVLAGLPIGEPSPPPPPQPPTDDEVLSTVAGLVPSVLVQRGRSMNRIAANMISNLIDSMDIDPGRKRWLISQTRTGIVDPDIFMRDLRLSLR